MPRSAEWIKGYELAQKEWEEAQKDGAVPAFVNPFAIGTEAEEGFEEAVYQFTQK